MKNLGGLISYRAASEMSMSWTALYIQISLCSTLGGPLFLFVIKICSRIRKHFRQGESTYKIKNYKYEASVNILIKKYGENIA